MFATGFIIICCGTCDSRCSFCVFFSGKIIFTNNDWKRTENFSLMCETAYNWPDTHKKSSFMPKFISLGTCNTASLAFCIIENFSLSLTGPSLFSAGPPTISAPSLLSSSIICHKVHSALSNLVETGFLSVFLLPCQLLPVLADQIPAGLPITGSQTALQPRWS